MKTYRIRNWENLFENNRSKELKNLKWVVTPNSHDGASYSQMINEPDGVEMFGAWVLIIQVASKCEPRGTLVRGDGKPMTAAVLSLKTRAPAKVFEKTLNWLETHTDWIEVFVNNQQLAEVQKEIPHVHATIPPSVATIPHDVTKKGREGKGREGNGKEENGRESACAVLSYLNLLSGKQFRETDTNLKLIEQRLEEPGVTEQGIIQMIERQCELWLPDEKMREYLRPETLFRKSKFDSYFAAKDMPVPKSGERPNQRNADMGMNSADEIERGKKTVAIIARKDKALNDRIEAESLPRKTQKPTGKG